MLNTLNQGPNSKTRRRHRKSRTGCSECKRRRVKCDESKPSCIRCTLLLDKCIYPPGLQSITNDRRDDLSRSSSSCSSLPSSTIASSHLKPMPPFEAPIHTTSSDVDVIYWSSALNCSEGPSDTELHNHYLQHTAQKLTPCLKDRSALQTDMPKLALQSKTVFHSLLAASAACLCHDMISSEPSPHTSAVNQVLMTGYQHYNLAIKRMRESISSPKSLTPESLLASAVLLVPFATASQQINHWIFSRSETKESCTLLSTTPRDVIIIMRAIRTMLQSLRCDNSSPIVELSLEIESTNDCPSAEITIPPALAPSRTHVMNPILVVTVQRAFSKLQQRLDSALLHQGDDPEGILQACGTTLEILKYISSKIFPTCNIESVTMLNNSVEAYFKPEPVPLPQVPHWLRAFARKAMAPLPTEPLTGLLLSFLVHAPKTYLDLVLPLLDQRLGCPMGASSDHVVTQLTREQALALDIYAHWSVLMFLAEEDSWWIGNLPVVTLVGLLNKYGDDFVTRLWPEMTSQEPWWPGSMLGILREIKQHR